MPNCQATYEEPSLVREPWLEAPNVISPASEPELVLSR